MKSYFLLSCLVVMDLTVYAQTQNLSFAYDEAGNRYAKNLVQLKSANKDSTIADHHNDTTIYREILEGLTVTLYPNPTNGFINVKLENFNPITESRLIILDSAGKLMYVQKPMHAFDEINLTEFSPGLYFLRIEVDKTVSNWTIIKE